MPPGTAAVFAASAACAAAWIAVQLRAAAPMIDVRMLTRRVVLLTNAATALAGFSVFALFVLVPRLVSAPRGLPDDVADAVDYGFGANSTRAGLYMGAAMVTGLLGALSIGGVTRRVGWKPPLVAGLLFLAAGTAALALWHERPWQVVLALMLVGYVIPITTTTTAKLVADAVRPEEQALVAGLNMVAYYVGGVAGGMRGDTQHPHDFWDRGC